MRKDKNAAHKEPKVHLSISQYQHLLDTISQLTDKNSRLQEENYQLLRRLWGKKSEKRLPDAPCQLSICWQTPQDAPPQEVIEEKYKKEVATEKKNYSRFRKDFKGKKIESHSRKPLPEELERREVILLPDVDLKGAKEIGKEITERLEIEPAKVYVARTVRPKYRLVDGRIVIAPLPIQALSRSNAGATMVASLAVSKYTDHLPLHRQLEIFRRQGLRLAASTVNGWCQAGAQELEPIYNELRELLRSSRYVMADETPYKVLESDQPGSLHQGYMWNFYLPSRKTPFFEYHKGRGQSALGILLDSQVRVVQSDGYIVYELFDDLPGYLHLACWAHARRKYVEAESSDPLRAAEILKMIADLYRYEQEIRQKGLTGDDKVAYRRKYSYPKLKQIEEWVEKHRKEVKSGSLMDKAILYTYGRMEQLSGYVNEAEFEIDNNAVERSIRPLTLNRKNVLFGGSHDAAYAAAIYFTLLGCCRENNVNPRQWMEDVLIRVKTCKPTDYSGLIPFNWKKEDQTELTQTHIPSK